MQLINPETKIDFLSRAKMFGIVSAALVAGSILLWLVQGFNLSIEFKGGTELQIRLPEGAGIDVGQVRAAMGALGYPEAQVVRFGDEDEVSFLLNLDVSEEEASTAARAAADARSAPKAETREAAASEGDATATEADTDAASAADAGASDTAVATSETDLTPEAPTGDTPEAPQAGPDGEAAAEVPAADTASEETPGDEGTDEAAPLVAAEAEEQEELLTGSLVGVLIPGLSEQLSTRVVAERIESIGPRVGDELIQTGILAIFTVGAMILVYIGLRFELRYAPGAVLALLHDVIITAGIFVLFQLKFDLQVLVALLVVLGYSLNDTIVIYDRIRENLEMRGDTHLEDVVNQSINQTLSRTLLTSLTTLIVLSALILLGTPSIQNFALALFIGVLVGTYSTVYVASTSLVYLHRRAVQKAGATA